MKRAAVVMPMTAQPVKLLTELQAAERALYFERGLAKPVRAFQAWARRAGLPVKYSGRKRLYDPRILEAFLDREDWTRRHASPVRSVNRPRPVHARSVAEAAGSAQSRNLDTAEVTR